MRTMVVDVVGRNCTYREVLSERQKTVDGDDDNDDGVEVLGGIRPLIARVFGQFKDVLEAILRRHPGAPLSSAVGERIFLSGLSRQVLDVVAPTVAVELEAARMGGMLRGTRLTRRSTTFSTTSMMGRWRSRCWDGIRCWESC
jgi:hypothetical protein